MKNLIIKTKAWTRGEYCNEYGHCCAVGFLAKDYLKKKGVKRPLMTQIDREAECIYRHHINLMTDIIKANDYLKGKERRTKLRELFKKNGYRLIFK